MAHLMLEIPEWAMKQGLILVLAGQELLASYNPSTDELSVKDTRCDRCGSCCLNMPQGYLPWPVDEEGVCSKLDRSGDKWICTAGHQKPFCCLSDPLPDNAEGCSIRYK